VGLNWPEEAFHLDMNSANGGPHVGFQCIGANATSTIGNMLARNDMQLYTYCVWTPRHNALLLVFSNRPFLAVVSSYRVII